MPQEPIYTRSEAYEAMEGYCKGSSGVRDLVHQLLAAVETKGHGAEYFERRLHRGLVVKMVCALLIFEISLHILSNQGIS